MAQDADLDPEYEWVEIRTLSDREGRLVRGAKIPCAHVRRIPVESALEPAVVLAQLCLECDQQLHARFVSQYEPPTHVEINAEILSA